MIARSCYLFLLTLLAQPVLGDASRYYVVPESRSPKGTYELVLAVKGGGLVDWSKAEGVEQYRIRTLGSDGQNVQCWLVRRQGLKRVQVVPGVPYGPSMYLSVGPSVLWSPTEDRLLVFMHGHVEMEVMQVVEVNARGKDYFVDILPLVNKSLHRYMRKLHPAVHPPNGHPYVFYPQRVRFLAHGRVVLTLGLGVPKAGSDWSATVRAELKVARIRNSLRSAVLAIRLLTVHPDSSER